MKEITGILAAPIFKLGLQRSLLELQLRETLQQKPNSATLRTKTRNKLKGNELKIQKDKKNFNKIKKKLQHLMVTVFNPLTQHLLHSSNLIFSIENLHTHIYVLL